MSLAEWMEKYVVPMDAATANDTAALNAFLLQLEGISDAAGLQYYADMKWKTRLEVWFRYGRSPRIVDADLNAFEFTFENRPLCILHPDCTHTRDCPLILINPRRECCFEPIEMDADGFPSPNLSLVKGDPMPMMILVRRAIKKAHRKMLDKAGGPL